MSQNLWDILGQKTFNTQIKEEEVDPRTADNILLAWPPILELLAKHYAQTKNIKVLDFGCGAGGFCNKLHDLGFEMTGIDPSVGMIESARQHSFQDIQYILGDQNTLTSSESFDVITSIMTLPFIENIFETFKILTNLLKPNGLFCIAVFNPEWVKESLKKKMWFSDFDSSENPKVGWKTFGQLKTPIFIRDAKTYTDIAKRYHLHQVLLEYPVFTPEFMQKYPDYYPNNVSEYIILGFQKEK
ncbi:class I SAM-dependent methyltransferase [Candidatus Gottesmanbacteria bacterium]|nr:class I SAM-dependent methyltransferase [Candidatus Gottesmanbacteria bacterium]